MDEIVDEKEYTSEQSEGKSIEDLLYYEQIAQYVDIFQEKYSPQTKKVYRLAHHPLTEDDGKPQVLQSFNPHLNSPIPLKLKDAPVEVVEEAIGRYSLSVFDSAQECETAMRQQFEVRKNEKHRQKFIDKKGEFITELSISESDGWLENEANEKGHRNFHPYKDFDMSRHVGEVFKIKFKTNDGNDK